MGAVEPPSSSAATTVPPAPAPDVVPSSDAAGHTLDSEEQLAASVAARSLRAMDLSRVATLYGFTFLVFASSFLWCFLPNKHI